MTVLEKKACPFCPGSPETIGKTAPYWLPNAFPMLVPDAPSEVPFSEKHRTMPAKGYCEVVVESFDHRADLCDLTEEELKKAMLLYRDRYLELSRQEFVKAVLIFRNLGKTIGVSIEHPHSQIYAVPYVPPILLEEAEQSKHGCPVCSAYQDKERIIFEDELIVLYMPFAPRWPYEVHVTTKRHVTSLSDATEDELVHLGTAIGRIVGCYHHLFNVKMPYVLAFHQAPAANSDIKIHLHVELYPALRAPDKLKHWGGAELGFGAYTYDFAPEDKAEELKAICNKLDKLPISSKDIPEPQAVRWSLEFSRAEGVNSAAPWFSSSMLSAFG